jgi:excinuclease ABC subunit C
VPETGPRDGETGTPEKEAVARPQDEGARGIDGEREEPAAEAAPREAARERSRRELSDKVDTLPSRPGVYLFKDARGKVIYVGKAKSLRDRLRSYLNLADGRYQVRFLMDRAADVETLVVASETEALILENNLIKQYKPRYNVRLKDDKSYLSVKVTTKDRWPRIFVTRRIVRDGNLYLGPYGSAAGLRDCLDTIRKVFPLRTCSDAVFRNRARPCLEYQIKRCLGPCVLPVDEAEYRRQLDGAVRLLEGRTDELIAELEAAMERASEEERFEDAARLRDRVAAVARVAETQKVVAHEGGDRDVFGYWREGGFIEAQVLLVRGGKLVSHHSYNFDDYDLPDEEVLSSLVGRFYEGERFVPDEILLPLAFEAMDALAEYLSGLRRRRVMVAVPQRGEKRRLVEMAVENAAHGLRERTDESVRRERTLEELQRRLGLANVPKRIECFDISHSQGEAVVASLVAFDEGVPDKKGYRRYKLRGVQRNDDFAAMREVLSRRLTRGRDEGGLPDLIVVDGGRGQLAMAVEALRETGVEGVELASLAKERVERDARSADIERKEERVYRPGRANYVSFRRGSDALRLLQHVRDEAHRFAITFHRKLRSKRRLRSALDDVPGIGPARRRALLAHFGSLKRIREASLDEIASLSGIGLDLAARIRDALAPPPQAAKEDVAAEVGSDGDPVHAGCGGEADRPDGAATPPGSDEI